MNIHNRPRTIYFARVRASAALRRSKLTKLQSGQSLIEHSYKADSDLSPAGWEYAERLKEFVLERRAKLFEQKGVDPKDHRLVVSSPPLSARLDFPDTLFQIWSSARRRSHHTAWPFLASSQANTSTLRGPAHAPADNETDVPIISVTSPVNVKVVEKAQMGEINPGVWDGLNPDQARKYYPDEWERFVKDPYAYRAPRAESYHDLCGMRHALTFLNSVPNETRTVRLEPILIELEREQEDLLIIGHASVIRCLLAYLIGLPGPQVPAIEVARGDLLEVTPTSYGVHCQTFHFWDGPGRRSDGSDAAGGKDETNFYENYAEDTRGKKIVPSE